MDAGTIFDEAALIVSPRLRKQLLGAVLLSFLIEAICAVLLLSALALWMAPGNAGYFVFGGLALAACAIISGAFALLGFRTTMRAHMFKTAEEDFNSRGDR